MVSTGFAIYLGLLFLLVKLPRRWALRLLHHDLAVDLVVTCVAFVTHFGTFSGLMAATVAGVLTSVSTTVAKRLFGHVDGRVYYPGVFTLRV
jgi:NhaP-type Na+/H+ or K+/H+ antiporter